MRSDGDAGRTVIAMLTSYHQAKETGDRLPLALVYDEYTRLSADERLEVFAATIGYLHGATGAVADLLTRLHGQHVDFGEVVQSVALGMNELD